jgi:hypothetical protein
MTTEFEQQLAQMLPVIRDNEPKPNVRLHSVAKIALGFILGVFATYYWMQPHHLAGTPLNSTRQESFRLVLDESAVGQLRSPADLSRCIVRVPIPKPEAEQAQWQYRVLRESLLQL